MPLPSDNWYRSPAHGTCLHWHSWRILRSQCTCTHTQTHTHALKVLSCTPLKVSRVCVCVCVFTPWHQPGYWRSLYRWDWLLHTLSTGRTHSTSNTSRMYTHTYICTERTTSPRTTHILYALHQTLKHASTHAHIHRYFHCVLSF